jgi:hypothetical protein
MSILSITHWFDIDEVVKKRESSDATDFDPTSKSMRSVFVADEDKTERRTRMKRGRVISGLNPLGGQNRLKIEVPEAF